MAKHNVKLKVGLISHNSLRHMCESYCMVKAIHKTLKLVVKEHGYLEPEFPNPAALRRIRENIFQQEIVPNLKSIYLLSPKSFAQWVLVFERQKSQMMMDIDAIYAHAREVNEGKAEKFLVYQRMAATVGSLAAGTFLVLGAGAVLMAMGGSAALAVGAVTTQQATAALATATSVGRLVIVYNLIQGGVSIHRKMEEMGDAHVLAMVGEKGVAIGTERYAHHAAEHTAEHAAERSVYENSCYQAVREGSMKLGQNPEIQEMCLKNAKLQSMVNKSLLKGGAAGVGVVFCACAELHETYEQFIEDWNAGTNHGGGGHGHGEH